MPASHSAVDPHREQQQASSSSTSSSASSSGFHTPAANYRTATGTISNVFASLWGTYSQQQTESGPSRPSRPTTASANAASNAYTNDTSPSPSVPGGWSNLLSWGPAAAAKRKASPSRKGKRAGIPFSISSPLEAEKGSSSPPPSQPPQPPQPRRKALAGVFESPSSPPRTPSRGQVRDPTSPSLDESPNTAYATLSRLRSKPSVGKLRSSSGFLWPSSTANMSESTPSPTPATPAPSGPAANWSEALARAEKLDSYVRQIVFQAGLDYESRPMVVLAACCLPDPEEVDYDALLDRIMDTMDLFVENDYTVVYFAGGGHHRPGWNWIWRAYRRLDRRFRKNLKKLYIVHPTFFTRSLMQFVGTGAYFVSPKFGKKVTQLWTLSGLAVHVPLTQIDIPPGVLQWNKRYEEVVELPPTARQAAEAMLGVEAEREGVFGVDLGRLMGEYGNEGVPRVVKDCVEAILGGDFGGVRPVEMEGIFRRSPSSVLLKTAQEAYDRGHPVSLEQYRDANVPAVLLKVYLRSLPRPIFPREMYGLIRACPTPPPAGEAGEAEQETIRYLRGKLLTAMHPCSGILLSCVLEMLHKVSLRSAVNKMDAANLATVMAPNLVDSGNAVKDVLLCRVDGMASMGVSEGSAVASPGSRSTTLGSIVRFAIERYYEIFDEVNFLGQVNTVQEMVDGLPNPGLEEDASGRTRSVSRLAAQFGGRGVGRNSSGSLRLTKGKLSSGNLRAGFASDEGSTDGLTAQLSGVSLTGVSATGRFSTEASGPSSPLAPKDGVVRSRSVRRELSEVVEADD